MLKINPLLNCDFYKTQHHSMYPPGITFLYSNFTPRKSRIAGVESMVLFGLQYYCKEYLITQWNEGFFNRPKDEVLKEYSEFIFYTLGIKEVEVEHIAKLHDLGYLPICIKALPEGVSVPMRVPAFVIYNTHDDFAWFTNFLETSISNVIWAPSTTATIAREYKRLFDEAAMETVGNTDFTMFQGHDFAQRGYSSVETSATSGAGHLLNFYGTDTIPAIQFLQQYYGADISREMVGTSVPATEHSVMTSYGKESEIDAFKRLLTLYPSGILSVVSDSFDLWKVCTEYVVELKDQILARDGKLVIRPDSGDPVDILCGYDDNEIFFDEQHGEPYKYCEDITGKLSGKINDNEYKGVIELLWDVFGGTITEKGYKLLDSHIGTIYGDSITLKRANQINERLKAKGFASINWVAGIGSYTYQYITRDTFGSAMKATYCEVEVPTFGDLCDQGLNRHIEHREIFKDPITDDGTKKSAKGLIRVEEVFTPDSLGKLHHSTYKLFDRQTKEQADGGALNVVFQDSKLIKEYTLAEVRKRIAL